MACKLTPVQDSPDFDGPAGQDVTIATKDHVGRVLIVSAEYGGTQLVPDDQAVRKITFRVAAGRNTLKFVCTFAASTMGRGELREDASPDSQFLRALFGHEPFQFLRIIGK
jgi:hypothetical protein